MKINHWLSYHLNNGSAVLGAISGTAVAFFLHSIVPILIGLATTAATHFLSRYLKKKYPH